MRKFNLFLIDRGSKDSQNKHRQNALNFAFTLRIFLTILLLLSYFFNSFILFSWPSGLLYRSKAEVEEVRLDAHIKPIATEVCIIPENMILPAPRQWWGGSECICNSEIRLEYLHFNMNWRASATFTGIQGLVWKNPGSRSVCMSHKTSVVTKQICAS